MISSYVPTDEEQMLALLDRDDVNPEDILDSLGLTSFYDADHTLSVQPINDHPFDATNRRPATELERELHYRIVHNERMLEASCGMI